MNDLQWYRRIKSELAKSKIPVDNISELVRLIIGIEIFNCNTMDILNEVKKGESLRQEHDILRFEIATLKRFQKWLDESVSILQQQEYAHQQALAVYHELETLGFGLKGLKRLRYTVEEISKANNISPFLALGKFFKDIEEQYDNKLGFESKLNELKLKMQELSFEEANLRTHLSTLPVVSSSLSRLLQKGLSEQDIVSIDKLLRNDIGDGKKMAITVEELNSLIRELRQNGKTELIFSEIAHQLSHSKKELSLLQRQNSELHMKIQNMLYAGFCLDQILEHFREFFYTSIKNGLSNYLHLLSTLASALSLSTRQSIEPQSGQASKSSNLALTPSSEEAKKTPMVASQT